MPSVITQGLDFDFFFIYSLLTFLINKKLVKTKDVPFFKVE